ncbi:MAG: CDP-alcohol phosphatidyltransferase family protein [Bacillota bacterium]|jgi:cardiolipin synthase|nr:CDP-alcohol phosphatidyltransferase family protein [Bacillota bacterium]
MHKVSIRSKLTTDQVFTIPNILSFFRLLLIPLIVFLYVGKELYGWTLVVLIISLVTDIIDGLVARKLNMVTDFGKFIDPVADKLTQLAVLFCLVTRFPLMWIPISIMLLKEILQFALRFVVFRYTGEVHSAEWHGKVATFLIYVMMSLHVIWYGITDVVSTLTITITSLSMLLSCVLYTISSAVIIINIKRRKKDKEQLNN